MNRNIAETRKISISDKVISPDNIRSLANVLQESYEEGNKEGKSVKLNFRIASPGGAEYESDSTELFKEGGLLHQKWISYFEMEFFDFSSDDSRIFIKISHDDRGWPFDQIKVSGKNSVWVNGQFQRFENIIENWEPQVSWPRKYERPLEIIIGIGFGRAYFFVLDIIFGYMFSYIPIPKIESPERG